MKARVRLLPVLALAAVLAAPGAWGQRQGRGGMGRGTVGTVSKVDAAAGTLEVSSRRGDTQTFTIPASATVLRQTTAALSDLKVGDTITVAGVPRQIDARQIQSGESLQSLLRPQGAPGGGAARPRAGAGRFGARLGGLQVRGTVTSTTPTLQLRMEDGTTVQVSHSNDTRFNRTVRSTLAEIKSGEQVTVLVEPGGTTVRAVLVSPAQNRDTVRIEGRRAARRAAR